MNMNIYITPENEQYIRRYAADEKGTMSGLVNGLLADYFKAGGKQPAAASPVVTNTANKVMLSDDDFRRSIEQPCCDANNPCKHWSFDGANGAWKNTLSGRVRETV